MDEVREAHVVKRVNDQDVGLRLAKEALSVVREKPQRGRNVHSRIALDPDGQEGVVKF